jgi:hypothetical protein
MHVTASSPVPLQTQASTPDEPTPEYRVSVTCPWCYEVNDWATSGKPRYCDHCRHRADVPRMFCDCDACDAAVLDTSYLHKALAEVAPGKRFCELSRHLQSRVVLLAQELKNDARKKE